MVEPAQSFRPDSPANALVYIWPGVPILAFACGLALSLYELALGAAAEYLYLAAFMALGLVITAGPLVRAWFFGWYIITVDRQGVHLRAVARERLSWGRAVALPWSAVERFGEVTTPTGARVLTISAGRQTYRIPRMLYRQETYDTLRNILSQRLNESAAPRAA